MVDHKALMLIRDRLHTALREAQEQRHERNGLDANYEPGWVLYERELMHREVCAARARLGLGPIALTEVARVEAMAMGHSDYSAKWSLYCAELVILN